MICLKEQPYLRTLVTVKDVRDIGRGMRLRLVIHEQVPLRERPVTGGAGKGSILLMDQRVSLQGTLLREALLADVARERLHGAVDLRVPEQRAARGEALAAVSAHVLLGLVVDLVLLQLLHRTELSATRTALVDQSALQHNRQTLGFGYRDIRRVIYLIFVFPSVAS